MARQNEAVAGEITPPTEESLTARTSSSILWMTLQRWATRLGGLATLMILTRVLAPEDFGLASAATTLIPILYVISDIGFSTYIVQARRLSTRTLNTAFWFSLLCGLVLAGAVVVAAPLMALVVGEPAVAPLIQVMAVSVGIVAVTSVPISLLRRRMEFRRLAVIEVSSALVAQAAAITAALLGAGAWALVLQVLVSQVIYGVAAWFVSRWRPGVTFSRTQFIVMLRFGGPIVGSGLVTMTRYWLETVIIISALGVREMGFIIIAQRLVLTAQELSVSALLPVATAAFARVKETTERLRSAYLRATAISYAAVAPLMLFVAVAAPTLVPFLFGADKSPSAAIVPAIVVTVLLNVSWAIDQGLYLGAGRPLRWFILVTATTAVALGTLALIAPLGLAPVLITMACVAAGEAVVRWFVVAPVLRTRVRDVAFAQLGIIAPSVLAGGVGVAVMQLGDAVPEVALLALTGTAIVVVYLIATRFLRPRVFADTVTMLPARIGTLLIWGVPRRLRSADGGVPAEGEASA
ncbi:oligosaccharide flippase family protein [Microbacterium aurum]|uniref:oligosaccharide flippase family protein n=1 Tax=Microbacterium aurum TaxID=36805 RepID=UPI0028E47ED2|nr:oligosaccharide flippase family protein [Microbacterium aurum]